MATKPIHPPDLEALARKLAESGRVPWVRGMVEADGATCAYALDGEPTMWMVDDNVCNAEPGEECRLDLTDDGNRGHLLARARVLWGVPELHPQWKDGDAYDGEWCMFVDRNMPLIWRHRVEADYAVTVKATGATEIAAIVAAILAPNPAALPKETP